jgi:hypothetical protein
MKTNKIEIKKRVGSDFRFQQSQSAKQRMIEILKSGGYCYRAPAFYINAKTKSGIPTLVIDDNADLLRQAFSLLAKENKTLYEVSVFLKLNGIKISKHQLENIITNRVYLGEVYIPPHNGIPGHWIKGIHKPIVDNRIYEILNDKHKKENK